MPISTIVKKPLPVRGRPLSLAATIGVLGVSLYISHRGLERLFPAGELVLALTALLLCLAVLQWTALGRAHACHAAGDATRRNMAFAQAGLLGLVEVTMNWNGVVQMAGTAGLDWGGVTPAGLLVAIFAIGGALLNVTMKWTSCEPLGETSGDAKPAAAGPLGPRLAYDAEVEAASGGRDMLRRLMAEGEAERMSSRINRDPATGQFLPKSRAA